MGWYLNICKKAKIMGEIILKKAVERESGYLYYLDGEGNVCRAKLNRGGRPEKKEVKKWMRKD